MADIRLLELRNTYKWGGGPDKTILLSAERHNRARVEVVVAYVRDAWDSEFRITDKIRARGVTVYEVKERGKLDLGVLWTLRNIVLRHDINLIHSHDYKSDLLAYLLRRWLRCRRLAVISTMHGWALLGTRGRLYWRLDLWLLRRFDHLLAVSQATKDSMATAGIPSRCITVIHNGIDTETWSPYQAPPSLRESLGCGEAFPVVGYVGRIAPEKDLETWVRTAALVAQQYPKAQFVVVGDGRDGTLLELLKKLASEVGIARRLHFLGYREDLLSVYATFDLFLLSSRREGICNSLLEAMAMGLPVVTTDAGGTRELVLDGQTGFILQPGDVHGLARAVAALADDASLRRRMGQAGRERVERAFSFRHRLQRVEAFYATVLGLAPTYTSQIIPVETPF
jgi:glycosyltransferase involved in cell wall biosynthesis